MKNALFTRHSYAYFLISILLFMGCKKEESPPSEDYNRLAFGVIESIQVNSLKLASEDIFLLKNSILGSDGNYTFLGFNNDDILTLSKIFPSMDSIWSVDFGVAQQFYSPGVVQTIDNGYIIFGGEYATVGTTNIIRAVAIKLDENANIQWKTEFDNNSAARYFDLIPLENGDFLVAGYINNDGLIRRIGKDGEEIWTHRLMMEMESSAFTICQISDNQFIVNGASNNGDHSELLFVKINDNGAELSQNTFGEIKYSFDFRASNLGEVSRSQNGCIAIGSIENKNEEPDFLVTKVNENGTEEWTKIFGEDGNDRAVQILADATHKEHLIVATSEDLTTGNHNLLLIKIDNNGNWLWAKKCEGLNNGYATIIPSGGYLISGVVTNSSNNSRRPFFLKLDQEGNPM